MTIFDLAFTIGRIAVISIGILGSILSFIVFSRKKFQNNSISTYCRALAVFDCLSMIQLIQDVYRLINQITSLYDLNDVSCKIFYYIWMQYTSIPGWILVAFSVDKMLNMRASKPNILKSKLFQWSVIAGIVIFHSLIYIELLISLKIETMMDFNMCNFAFLDYFMTFVYAQLALSCVIPFTIMIFTSAYTIRLLIKSRATLKRNGNAYKKRRIRDFKYAISSLVFNVYFIAFKTPFMISPLLPENDDYEYFFFVSMFLFIFNCSSTFFVHLTTNSIFRREFFEMFKFKSSTNRIANINNNTCTANQVLTCQKKVLTFNSFY